ncbi:MAG: 1-deoxy-D-xylulose-5-phosphate reductoisomerase [Candidatus Dormibacteria bacterium]|jgi:1-deoxy-D-xylulose-5-phosphate reductoisomerase
MTPRRVVLLGATGSIGRQAVDVIARFPERFELVGVVAGRDVAGLRALADRFGVARAAVVNPDAGAAVPAGWGVGLDAACEIAAMPSDTVCVAITGAAALRPTLAALDAGNTVASATKEVLVMAGDIVRARSRASGARVVPIDSEHSALWQCLRGEEPSSVARLILTASGGPFRSRDPATFREITPEEALRHPTWTMGPKVTIDSATMMNKGLEIIEAHFLFDVDYARIEVLIHPTSIIHSMVEFRDGAVKAQLGVPDMRLPIALALTGGERLPGIAPAPDLTAVSPLHLEPADPARFPALPLARRAGELGGVVPAVLNAANEVCVDAFLHGGCRFDEIVATVGEAVEAAPRIDRPSLDDVVEADAWARRRVAGALVA